MAGLVLPSWHAVAGDRERALDTLDAWAGSSAVSMLVGAFGGATGGRRGAELLRWLDGFAALHWDFRRGRERNAIGGHPLTSNQSELTLALAPELGLADREQPTLRRYDTVLMTGGMVRAGIVKPRFVAELLRDGLSCDRVVFLGGFRPFAGDEAEVAAALGVRADNEFGAMVAGLDAAFGPLGEPEAVEESGENSYSSWRENSWSLPGLPRLSVLAAPSSHPARRRANSADTYRFWAERRRAPSEQSVLQVTTPIYVPYQSTVASHILGLDRGLAVETVGVGRTASDLGPLSQPFLPEHHLQEVRATIGAMLTLRARLAG